MKKVNDITEELNNMGSSLGTVSRIIPYSVPSGYFTDLPVETLKIVSGSYQADFVPGWSKTMLYTIPPGYFTGLTDNLVAVAKAGHSRSLLSKETPYTIPVGFFETFPDQILQAAKKASPVKKQTIHIPLGRNSFRQIRWAAAAVLLICIGFGGYETFSVPQDNTEKMLSTIPNNDIQDYLHNTYVLDVPRIVNNDDINNIEVDNKDIIQYLNETGWDMTE